MKRNVLGFDGGVNSKADPTVLKPDILTDCVNYENKDAGKVTKRVETAEFNAGLDTIIASTFDEVIYIPEEPFYPARKLTDMSEDVMYPVFGLTSEDEYLLYLFYYDTSDTWIAQETAITGIGYTSDSNLRISYDQGIMYIADWNAQNKTHRVYINTDYELIKSINEIPRPLNKPTSSGLTTFNISLFQENLETGSYINYCGVYRYWYTFITEDDDESNPSPASEWFDLQFFKKDEDDLDERMVKSVIMSNLEITSNASDIEDQIKWYGMYREELQFVEGIEVRTPKFIKKISSSDTEFTDTIAILSGDVVPDINYENDSSPVGKDIFSVGGALVLPGIQTKLELPFKFDYYREVTISNLNSKSYVNGVVCVEFENDGQPYWDYLLKNLDKVRLFDNDLTTPIPTVFKTNLITEGIIAQLDSVAVTDVSIPRVTYIDSTHYIVDRMGTYNSRIGIYSVDDDYDLTKESDITKESGGNPGQSSIALIDHTHFIIAYQLAGGTPSLRLATYEIVDDEAVLIADTNIGTYGRYPSIDKIDSTHFALAWDGSSTNAQVAIVTFDSSYENIALVAGSQLQHDYNGKYNSIRVISSSLLMLAFQDNGDDGVLKLFDVDSSWGITEVVGSSETFAVDGDYSVSYIKLMLIDDTHIVVTWETKDYDIGIRTYSYDSAGFTGIDTETYSTGNDLRSPQSVKLSKVLYAITYCDSNDSNSGHVATFSINSSYEIAVPTNAIEHEAYQCCSSIERINNTHFMLECETSETDGLLKTFEVGTTTSTSVIAYIKIPEIPISGSKKLYLAWCKEGGSDGVNIEEWRDAEYGQFIDSSEDFADQATFGNVGVNDVDTVISAPCQDSSLSEVINKADMEVNGELDDAVFHSGINICELPAISENLPDASKAIFITNNDSDTGCQFNFTSFDLPSSGAYIAGYVYIPGTYIAGGENVLIDMEFWYDEATEHFRLWLNSDGVWKTTCHDHDTIFDDITVVDVLTPKDEKYFVCLSWSDDENISLFVYNIADDTFEFQANPDGLSANYARYKGFNTFNFGSSTAVHYSIDHSRYANWTMQMGTYLSASLATHQNAVQNLANRMPLTDLAVIGYNWNTEAYNENISIGDIETLDYKEHPEWAGYSKVGGISFPDKYVKKCYGEIIRGIPTPSYLKGQTSYKNTVIFFYRNGFNVFPLEGDPSTWRDSAENLIPERKRDGLVCADSLVVTPHGLIWLTEKGIQIWNASSYRNITEGRMDIPIKDSYKGIYLPISEQYLLHDNSFTSESAGVTFDKDANTLTHGSTNWNPALYKVGVKIFISNAQDTDNNKSYLITAVDGSELTVDSVVNDETADLVTIKTTKSYVYDLPEDKLTTFSGLDILYATALSGGSTTENLNLFLNSYGELVKFPDYNQDYTSILAYAEKVFATYYAHYSSFNPEISGSATYDCTIVDDQNSIDTTTEDRTIYNMKDCQFPIGFVGNLCKVKIKDADEIKNIIIAYSPRSSRR